MSASAVPATNNDHPLVGDVNAQHQTNLSGTERFCKRVADMTGAPMALMAAIVLQIVWIVVGILTHWDPFPFIFLLTCSNVIQLILIFVIAVAERQSSEHDELRAENDHETISRLLYHQETQEQLLLALAEKAGVDVAALRATVGSLATS
jgi:uncharacterized membrane protein